MIILLAGEPHTGKSTAARKFIERFDGDCRWVLTPEIAHRSERVGFEVISQSGGRGLLAHQTEVQSPVVVGSHRYRVDTAIIDQFYTQPLLAAIADPPGVFVLDEIGLIQRQSPNFTPAVAAAFARNLNLLALISTRDRWTARYRHHPYAVCLAVTPSNRDLLPDLLVTIFSNLPAAAGLLPAQRQVLLELSQRYAKTGNLLLLGKLYGNALRYLTQHRLRPAGPDTYKVTGDHGGHTATLNPPVRCDCDLFYGRAGFAGQKGDCSHLMAARLLRAV